MSNQQSTLNTQQSLTRIAELFTSGHAALMPYFPLGFPDAPTSLDVIVAMNEAGADAFEIGLSFSDPLADGPVIQHATQVGLEQGITVKRSVQMIAELRARGVTQPLLVMLGTTKITGQVAQVLAQMPEVVKSLTGADIPEFLKSKLSGEAKDAKK